MDFYKRDFFTHRLYSSIDPLRLQEHIKVFYNQEKKDAYKYLQALDEPYLIALSENKEFVHRLQTYYAYTSKLDKFPLIMFESRLMLELLVELYSSFTVGFSIDAVSKGFFEKILSNPYFVSEFRSKVPLGHILTYDPVIIEVILDDPEYRAGVAQKILEHDQYMLKFTSLPIEVQEHFVDLAFIDEIKDDFISKRLNADDIPYSMLSEVLEGPDAERVFKTQIPHGFLGRMRKEGLRIILDDPGLVGLIKEYAIIIKDISLLPLTVQRRLLTAPEIRSMLMETPISIAQFQRLDPTIINYLLEHGLFNKETVKPVKEVETVYPENLTHNTLELLRKMDKDQVDHVTPEDLKSYGLFDTPDIKDLFMKHQHKNRLHKKDIISEGTEKSEEPSQDQDAQDLRVALLNKGETKHQLWNGDQRPFPVTNHVFLWILKDDLIPVSFYDVHAEDILGPDSFVEYLEETGEETHPEYMPEHISLLENYIEKSSHPSLPDHLTIGWVRYSLVKDINDDQDSEAVWIDEIQSDIHKLFRKEDFKQILSTSKLYYLLTKRFVRYIRSKGFEKIYIPGPSLASSLYKREKPPIAVYKDIPRKLKFKKTKAEGIDERVDGKDVWVLAKKKYPGYTFDI